MLKCKIKPLEWETNATGLKFGELVFDEEDENDKISGYDYIVARLKQDDKNLSQKILFLVLNGFTLSDIFFVFDCSIPYFGDIDFSKWKDLKVIFDVRNKQKEIFSKMMERIFVSRYFYELPFEIVEKIYKKWLEDIISFGRAFAVVDNSGIRGFLGHTVDGGKAKNFLLFGESMSFAFLIKAFSEQSLKEGIKKAEIKISLKNKRALKILWRWIRKSEHRVYTEFVFSKF